MRNWCAAVAVSALLAGSLCARQHDGAADSASPAKDAITSPAPKLTPGDITPAARSLFALPEAPRAKALPADKKSSDSTPPGRLLPRYEVAGMFNYVNFHPGDP